MAQTVTQGKGWASRARFARALRSRPFALLWLGQTISAIGDGAFFTALAWQVLLLTHSGAAMGVALVAETIPLVAFMLVGGVVADRLPRRLTLLWSDGGRAVVTLAVAGLGFAGLLQFWHLVALAAVFGLADAFFRPAYQSIPPQLVPAEDLPSANALTSFARNATTLIGPGIGAALVSLASPAGAFAFDGATFVFSAVCLVLMGRIRERADTVAPTLALDGAGLTPTAEVEAPVVGVVGEAEARGRGLGGVLADIREGLAYVTGSTWLWVTIAIASLGNVAFAPLQVALPKLVHDTYHQGVWLLGAVLSASAVGSIVASLVMAQARRVRRRGLVAYGGLIVSSVALLCLGLPLGLPFGGALLPGAPLAAGALLGAGFGVFEVIWVTVMQELVPADKLGRVTSVDWMGSLCLAPIGLGVVGALTDVIGPAQVFLLGGALNIGLTLVGLATRGVRELE